MKFLFENWRRYLTEDSKALGIGAQGIQERLKGYSDYTWIFFDTETMGLGPSKDQLTEIAAMAVNPNTGEVLGQFNEKIKLDSASLARLNEPDSAERVDWETQQSKSKRRLKEPQDILRLTRYGEKGRGFVDEQSVLQQFEEFIDSFPNPLLVAQNASFDMKFVNTRKEERLKKYPVFDTLPFIQYHVIPMLKAIETSGDGKIRQRADEILGKLFSRGFYSASLGKVAKAFGIDVEGWHNALADVKMTIDVFNALKRVAEYAATVNLEYRPEQEKVIKKKKAWKGF